MNPECEGFTFSDEFKCILHKTAKAVHFTQRKISQVGIRKEGFTLPKYCEEEKRTERCKNEPKCEKILDCFRKGSFILYRLTCMMRYHCITICDSQCMWHCEIAFKVMDITQDMSKIISGARSDLVNVQVLH